MLRIVGAGVIAALALMPSQGAWAQGASSEQIRGLDEQVQEAKSEVLDITAELQRLEEKLLFPSNTQISLFISVAKDDEFRLDAVKIELDGVPVASHIYSYKELEALRRGGVQKIYTGNVRSGEHQVQVSVVGKTAGGRSYEKASTFAISKEVGPKLVGLVLSGPDRGQDSIALENW